MQKIKSICFYLLFSSFLLIQAAENTITLQQGLNGYRGCTDTYVTSVIPDDDKSFGSSEELQIHYLSC